MTTIKITASAPTPTACTGIPGALDFNIRISDLGLEDAVATLLPDATGNLAPWGERPDHWLSGDLAAYLYSLDDRSCRAVCEAIIEACISQTEIDAEFTEPDPEPTLFDVAEGILDSASEEFLESNLESAASVARYADGAFNLCLLDSEAERVRAVCCAWVARLESGEIPGPDEYYRGVELQLTDDTSADLGVDIPPAWDLDRAGCGESTVVLYLRPAWRAGDRPEVYEFVFSGPAEAHYFREEGQIMIGVYPSADVIGSSVHDWLVSHAADLVALANCYGTAGWRDRARVIADALKSDLKGRLRYYCTGA